MKRCFRCLSEKPLEGFYKHARMSDGRLNKCKECTKADVIQNRLDKLEYYRSYDRKRASLPERVAAREAYQKTPEGRLASSRAKRNWDAANAVRRRASLMVNNAIKSGKLSKQPCFICGSENVHGHHASYDLPLVVTWLCPKHHKEAHRAVAEILYAEGKRETLHF